MSTTNKAELASRVAATLMITKAEATNAVNGVFDKLADALASGEKVQIPGLGTFIVKATAARKARNPITGAAVDVPAGKKVAFKPAADLKARL